MRDRDLELIAALVEGRLDDETEARALIESSGQARAEYEAQRLAFEALRGLGPATMTGSERSALHRDTWSALRSQPARRAASVPWYTRWIPATAGVLVLVVVGVIATLEGEGESSDFLEIGSTLRDATDSTGGGESAGDDDAGGGLAPMDAPTSTAAASSEEFSSQDAAFFSGEAARIRAMSTATNTTTGDGADELTRLERCLRDADLEGHVVADTVHPPEGVEATGSETMIAAVPENVAIEEAPITFVDGTTCEIVFVDE